jgi:plastocyanin
VLQADPCFNFGSIWMRTRSSNQVNSDPKDVVMPQPLVVGNCSLTIVKKTIPSTPSATFGFTAAGTNAADLGGGTFSLNGDGPGSSQTFNVHQGDYAVTEDASPGWVLTDVSCTGNNTSSGDVPNRAANVTIAPGDNVTCTFTNTQPATVTVAKTEAGSAALTQSWQFQLTGPGVSQTLTASSASASVQFDPVLPGTYQLCELGIPAGWYSSLAPPDANGNVCAALTLAAGDARNLNVDNVHPLVAIAKAGPASAPAGSAVPYTLTVTNPGNEPLPAPFVGVSDPLCQAPPALVTKNGDPTPDTLDPGDTWTYTCSVQTTATQTSIHNVATVTGQDTGGHTVSASAMADTMLIAPGTVAVKPTAISKLSGPTSCVSSRFTARVTGQNIARVVFYLDGKRVKTLTKPNHGKQFTLTLTPKQIGSHVRHIKAVVTYKPATKTKPKTLRMTAQVCPAHVKPFFTG